MLEEIKLFNVSFPVQLHTDIKTQAARLGIPMNDLIVNVMQVYIKKVTPYPDSDQEKYTRSAQDETSMSEQDMAPYGATSFEESVDGGVE